MSENKGYSLIELIVVIAILAVLGGVVVYSVSMLTGQEARECANNLSTALDKEKNYALTKSATADCYMELEKRDSGLYAVYYVPKNAIVKADEADAYIKAEEQKIGKKSVILEVLFEGDAPVDATVISGTQSVRIYYNRADGSFKKAAAVGAVSKTGYCKKMIVTRGKTYELELFKDTGIHKLSRR